MVYVRLVKLPTRVKGFTRKNQDDSYTVVLNENICREQQEETYLHEISHLDSDDFYSENCADCIENIKHL
mgnify:FL=1